ncbi:MAG: hypothetical protein HC905_24800 [Bacteroidales bacterium]|nr:hypothetical protein [Bacteroidales bacterium]
MKKLLLPYGSLLLFALILLTSCGLSGNYKAAESQIAMLQIDSVTTHELLEECYAQTNNLNEEKCIVTG